MQVKKKRIGRGEIDMNKKVIIGIIAVIVICVIGVVVALMINNNANNNSTTNESTNNNSASNENTNNSSNETSNNNENEENNNGVTVGSKTLVVYFSAQNHTEAVAKQIAENLDADIFEVTPKDVYTSDDLDWTDSNSRVSKEHDNESLRNIELVTTDAPNWEDYDTVLIGYPIWWGIAAWPIDNFVKNNDFTGKTVIPFCTSSSSGLGQSGEILEGYANGGNWQEGHRFSSNASDNDIKTFTDSIK